MATITNVKRLINAANGRLNAADKKLAERMIEWRKENNKTQAQAARCVGVYVSAWRCVESKTHFARPDLFKAIEELLDRPASATPADPAPVAVAAVPAWVNAQFSQLHKRLSALETALGVQTPIERATEARGQNGTAALGHGDKQ